MAISKKLCGSCGKLSEYDLLHARHVTQICTNFARHVRAIRVVGSICFKNWVAMA